MVHRPVELDGDVAERYGISKRLSVNARAAGPRLGKQVQHVIAGARAGVWEEVDGVVVVDGVALQDGEYELTLEAGGVDAGTAIALLGDGGFVLLDTQFLTPHLASLGGVEIPREQYEERLAEALLVSGDWSAWERS